jgi:hypothetical protein
VPIRWTTAQHPPSSDPLTAALDSPDGAGAVLVGPDGVGKTELARAAAEHFAQRPGTVIRWVTGTAAEASVPFGAFGHLFNPADVGNPAALLRAARASVAGGDAELLLVVDDAHYLDPLSATLVYQLAVSGSARLIVTVRADGNAPESVTALWADGLLARIDVEPPDPVAAVMPDSVDGYLAGLAPTVRAVLDYLSVHEPLALADLAALTADDAVEQAESSGAVHISTQAGDPEVYAAHPLYVERARAALDPAAARRLRTAVVTRLADRPAGHVCDRLRLAVLAHDSDAPQAVDDVIAAAGEALRLGDLALAERLARAATGQSDELSARVPLAYALAWQGRGREADAVLAAVDPARLSDAELMAWALPRAANQFWMLSEPERATAFLRTTRERISAPEARLTLDALSATFAMNAGNVHRALEIAADVLAAPDPPEVAVGWAASAASLSSARMGRFGDVDPLAERAMAAEHPGLLRFTIGLGQTTTLLMAGRATGAEELAREFIDYAELRQPGRAIGEVLLAQVLISRGEFTAAAALLGPASAALERTGYSWGPLSLTYLATALAQQGDIAAAAKALGRAESRHGTKSALFAPELGVARAWRLTTVRDAHGAIKAARDAAQMAERGGQLAVALWAWHEAVRLGDLRAADTIARLATEVDCVFARIAVAHARALTAGDGPGLAAAADDLAALDMHAAAADAAAQAAAANAR